MTTAQHFIVAEVSRNWPRDDEEERAPMLLAQRFELVIEKNRQRGYRLHSWKLATVGTWNAADEQIVNETIVAVFELVEAGT